ncbi:MAG: LptF/LptG family permease, partial [Ignavibacteria bacterium]|nr:LptF/LptG family permease [Ignavibacteria bacterium]
MKIIDRYVVKQFVQTIFFALLAFIAIFVIVDLMENLDDFLDQNVVSQIIFQYYIYFIPEIVKLITPVAVLFAGLFTVGKMSNTNELTAIKAGGVNLYRFMFPLIIVSFLVSMFSIYF